jgi:hypothetical protein
MMSNVEKIQSIYAAFGKGDIPHILNMLSEDVDWKFYGPAAIPFAGHYHGREDLARFFSLVGANAEVEVYDIREIEEAGHVVIVQGFQRVKVRSTGKRWETNFVHIYTFDHDQPVKVREYYDTAPMVEAFRVN